MKRGMLFQREAGVQVVGLFLAMVALMLPIIAGPVAHAAIARRMVSMATFDAMPMCMDRGETSPSRKGDVPQDHHSADHAMCPLCAALAHPAMGSTPAPILPPPSVVAIAQPASPPGARAPPALHASAAQPRGPPTQA